jgi:methionyl-tRNA synthetase
LGLLHKYCAGTLPASASDVAPSAAGHPLRAAAEEGAARAAEAYAAMAPHLALEAVVGVATRGNLFMEEVAPWTALKKVRAHAHTLTHSRTHARARAQTRASVAAVHITALL